MVCESIFDKVVRVDLIGRNIKSSKGESMVSLVEEKTRYILKVESLILSERLNVECKKKNAVKNDSKIFKLCNCKGRNIY